MSKKTIIPMSSYDGTSYDTEKWLISSTYLNDPMYLWEKKYDGSRYIIQRDDEGKVHLTSRTISVKTKKPVVKTKNLFGYLYEDHPELKGFVIDGEVIAMDNGKVVNGNGSSIVNKIMLSKPEKAKQRLSSWEFEIGFVAYDILYFNWVDVQNKNLMERKRLLEDALILFDNAFKFKYSKKMILSEIEVNPKQTYLDSVLEAGFEGIMLKHIASKYQQDKRSKDWIKVKKLITEDWIIIGGKKWTGKYSDTLGSLIIGQYMDDWKIHEVCTIWGMTDFQRGAYWDALHSHWMDGNAGMNDKWDIWLDEDVAKEVVEFVAQEKTKNKYRHPRFIRLRYDKNPKECVFNNSVD